MSQPLIYVDRSKVHDGALPELETAIRELAEFVAENEPQLISYSVYFSEDRSEMTVCTFIGMPPRSTTTSR